MTLPVQKTHWYDCLPCCKEKQKLVPKDKRKKQLRRARIDDLVVTVADGKIQAAHQRLQSTEVISIKKALNEAS